MKNILILFLSLFCVTACGKLGVSGTAKQFFGSWAEVRLPPNCTPKQVSAEEGSGVVVLCQDGRVFH